MIPAPGLNRRARDDARHELRRMIVAGQLPPASHLEEIKLSEQMGLSRTPVREALIALEQEGLVQSRPQRGFVVASPNIAMVRESYPVLSALETQALRMSTEALRRSAPALRELNEALRRERKKVRQYELDRAFHAALTDPCGNTRLLDLLRVERTRAAMIDGAHNRGMANLDGSCAEHAGIIDAIASGRTDRAAQLLAEHWEAGIEVVTTWLRSE